MRNRKKKELIKELFLCCYMALLRLAIPLALFSIFLFPFYFADLGRTGTMIKMVIHALILVFIILTSLLIIRKRGWKYFFNNLILYNLYFTGAGAKYYKIFFVLIMSLILLVLFFLIGVMSAGIFMGRQSA